MWNSTFGSLQLCFCKDWYKHHYYFYAYDEQVPSNQVFNSYLSQCVIDSFLRILKWKNYKIKNSLVSLKGTKAYTNGINFKILFQY